MAFLTGLKADHPFDTFLSQLRLGVAAKPAVMYGFGDQVFSPASDRL